jgi:hypothetical protein
MYTFEPEIVERHGTDILIMSEADWTCFKEKVKAKYPELYEEFKETMNFELTPVKIFTGEDND